MSQSKNIFMEQRNYEDMIEMNSALQNEANRIAIEDDLPYGPEEPDFTNLMVKSITPSKENVSLLAFRIQQQVADGKVDAIEAAISLNATKKMCEEALDLIRLSVVDELDKSSGKADKHGCKVERVETGTKYDYGENIDWLLVNEAEKNLAAQRKSLEDRLKKIPTGKTLVDDETGEVLTGPAKTSTTSFKVTLAK